jgi:hypothetical protein
MIHHKDTKDTKGSHPFFVLVPLWLMFR